MNIVWGKDRQEGHDQNVSNQVSSMWDGFDLNDDVYLNNKQRGLSQKLSRN